VSPDSPKVRGRARRTKVVRRALNNGGVEILMRKHCHGSISKRHVKIGDCDARFEDLDL